MEPIESEIDVDGEEFKENKEPRNCCQFISVVCRWSSVICPESMS